MHGMDTTGLHSPPAQDFSIFITECGRYWYLRMPIDLHTSDDIHTRSYDGITGGAHTQDYK